MTMGTTARRLALQRLADDDNAELLPTPALPDDTVMPPVPTPLVVPASKPDSVRVSDDPELAAYLDRLTSAQATDDDARTMRNFATVGQNLANAGLRRPFQQIEQGPSESDAARQVLNEYEALEAKKAARSEQAKKDQLEQAKADEDKRHHLADEEKTSTPRPGGSNMVYDEEGRAWWVDPRSPDEPGRPVVGPDGQQLKKRLPSPRIGNGGGDAGGKLLPPTTLDAIADVDTAISQVDKLSKKFVEDGQAGISGKAGSIAREKLGRQSGKAAEYEGLASAVRQAVGKILEGGKLAAGDEVKYKAMLPLPGDSLEVLYQKASGLKALLGELRDNRLKAYKAGGYRVPVAAPAPDQNAKPRTIVQNEHTYTLNPKTGQYE
jgi:hypothetical protein